MFEAARYEWPAEGAISTLRQRISDQKTERLDALEDVFCSPASLLEAAQELCRRAFRRTEAEAVRGTGTVAGRPVTVLDRIRLEKAVVASTKVASVAQTVQAITMARYAAIDSELVDSDNGFAAPVEHPLGHQAPFADIDMGAACSMSPRSASTRLSNAVDACTKTPKLLTLAVEADMPFWKVSTVAAELTNASAATAARVENHLLGLRGFDQWGAAKLKRTTRALVTQWEADAAKVTQKRRLRDLTGAWAESHPEAGLAELRVVGPTEQIAAMYGAADQLARHWQQHPAEQPVIGHPALTGPEPEDPAKPTLGQLRVQAMHDLIAGNASVSYQLVVQMPVVRTDSDGNSDDPPSRDQSAATTDPNAADPEADPDIDDDESPPGYGMGWARVPGIGFLHPEVLTALIHRLGLHLTRALVDAKTGVTVETSSTRYEPPDNLKEFVQARDGTCRHPNCSRPAIRTDTDHVIEWPNGPTAGHNLAALCRHHHNAKTARHWDYVMDRDGVCTWTSPTGRTYITYPDSTHDEGG